MKSISFTLMNSNYSSSMLYMSRTDDFINGIDDQLVPESIHSADQEDYSAQEKLLLESENNELLDELNNLNEQLG